MNARAYSYYPVTIYTLTNPTDKYGKLVRVKDNEYCLTDLRERAKPADTPNVWNSCDSPVPIRVEFYDLCVFLGNVEKSYSLESWKQLGLEPKIFPAYLLLHCASGQLLAYRTSDVTLEEVKGWEEDEREKQ